MTRVLSLLIKQGIGAPGPIADTQAKLYMKLRQANPDAAETEILRTMFVQRSGHWFGGIVFTRWQTKMKSTAMNLLFSTALLVPGSLSAQSGVSPYRLDGSVWIFRATIYPATTPTYQGTALFKSEGTLGGLPRDGHGSETIAGVWTRVGPQDYSFTFVADSYDSSGNFVESDVVTGVLHVSDDGLSATGTSLLERLDTAGKVIQPRFPPTSFMGTRIVAGTLPVE